MIRLVLPIENADVLEKARPGLIFRTDLPYHTAKGELKYRKGWVKPEDSRALDRAKKHGDPSTVIGKYQYEEDMFDDGEGEAWEKPKAAKEAKPKPEAKPETVPELVAEAKPVPEAPTEEAKAPLYIEDLTEKAIIVRGDTRTYKAAIKMAGGKWNSKHGGWIFPKKWESNVRARLAHLLVPPKSPILTSSDEPQKSLGHLGFFTVGGRRKELIEYETGGIYIADIDDVIDVRTGFRIGRWEGPAWQKDAILARFGLKAKEAPQEAPEAKAEGNIKKTPADAPSKQDSLPAGNSEQPSRVADRIAKPEVPDGEVAKTGDVQADLEKPIAKMKFRDYGSWSAAGKHLSPAKRAALNQEIAELLNLPADEISPKDLDMIRQYSGFGGVKAEDERGVLYDFYTSPPVARMVWKLANKIVPLASGARVLEPSCFTPDTLIFTRRGYVRIDSVCIGDSVFGRDGAWHEVNKLIRHKSETHVCSLTVGSYPFPLECTPDHKLLSVPVKMCPSDSRPCYYQESGLCRSLRHSGSTCGKYRCGEPWKQYSPDWNEAGGLKKSDYLVEKYDESVVDVLEIDFGEQHYNSKSPRYIPCNEDLLKVAGIYLADGCMDTNSVIFTFPPDKHQMAETVTRFFKSVGLDVHVSEKPNNKSKDYFVNSRAFVDFFTQFGRGAINKTIPEWCMILPIEKQKAILWGIRRGDGSNVRDGIIAVDTVSASLAFKVRSLLIRQGILPAMRKNKPGKGSVCNGKNIKPNHAVYRVEVSGTGVELACSIYGESHDLLLSRKKTLYSKNGHIYGGFVFNKITKKENRQYDGDVFDLTINSEHSYLAGPCTVHNCGTGVFFDVAPQGVDLTGVEFDSRTAAAASLLQPQARIYHASYEQFNLHEHEKFDAVVGNAPFGDRSVETQFLDESGEKSLDRYFISRSLDNLKSGGSMAMIVGPGVMDNSTSRDWRAKMLRKGQFIGAVRLPNESFKHTQTGVNPDVVMFRAYPEDVRARLATMSDEEMKQAGFFDEAFVEGGYFEENPAHRLGRVERGRFDSEVTVGKLDPADMDRAFEQFQPREMKSREDFDRVRSMTEGRKVAEEAPGNLTAEEAAAVAAKTLRVGMTKTVDGNVYRLNENHRWERVDTAGPTARKLDRIKEISETVRAIRAAMRNDEPVDDLQRQARSLIENYEKEFGSKHTDDKDIQRFLKANASVAGVYEAMTVSVDSDLLTQQNVYDKEIQIIDGHRPTIRALADMQRDMVDGTAENIRARFPNEADGLIEAMWSDPDVFLDADGIFRLREDFITGNAWEKIDALEATIAKYPGEEYAAHRERWQAGIEALRDAAGWVPIEDVAVSPQSVWIPEEVVNRWADTYRKAPDGYRYGRNEEGKWGIIADEETREWSWKKRTYIESEAGEWREHNDEFVYFLNSQKQRSKYTDTDTYNQNALAAFKTWLATDEDARKEVEEIYNRQFNTELGAPTKTYAVNLDGWSDARELKPWQWQSIHHLYRQGKGISALGTGYGKTDSAIGLFALLRQEGKAKRAFFQVPNNKVKDWVRHFSEDMPGLKIGAIDPEMEGMTKQENRFAAYQKLASGDYDVIILPESSASEIQLSEKADAEIVADYSAQMASKKEAEDGEGGKKKGPTAREQEKSKQRAETSLTGGKKNLTITFEDFGCDVLFCDEAHRQKNLFTSSLSRETGMNDGRRSDRALSFFKKCESIRRAHDGKNVFLLTATPLTNSPLEYYNMMQHVAPEMLKKMNISNIDQFIMEFADIETGDKFDPFSGQLKKGKVLVGFKNLKSLQDMFFKYTDLQNDPTKIGLVKPTPNNRANILPKADDQVEVVKQIAAEFERYKSLSKEEREGMKENNFTFYTRMRTASLDLELYDPERFKGWKNPKIEKMADNALETFNARGGGQVIFCDRVLSGDGSLNMHEKIKKALVSRGFKEDEIVIVNGLTKGGGKASDAALERLVSDAIDGYNGKYDKQGNLVVPPKYKFIIGTTQTIGEGVNLQKNSAALHHVDIPYRPSDFIQRNGRVDRQGNKQSTVELHSYAAAGTVDNYSMALVSGKEGWINQLLKTKSNVFTNPNGDGMDMDEILMSLTAEWGDKAGADQKRAAIEAKKAEAIKKENQKKSGDYLKQLSLMRGALAAYEGDKGSRDYQNRLRKIDNLEAALRNNPEFHTPEVLGTDGVPFIYHEGTGKVVRKGDLYVNQGRVFRVSGFNHKKRTFEISSAITGQVEGEEDAFASSTDRGYNRDRSFFVDNPTPEMVDHYIAMTDPEEFHKKPVEFKRDNYVDLVNMHARDYSSKVHPIVKDNDGDIRLASYYSEDYPLVNPYSDEGRAEIVSALEAGKLTASNYRQMEQEYGDLGGGEKARAVQLREFESEPKAKAAMEAMPKIRANAEGWYSLRELAEKMPVEGRYVTEYELRTLFNNHPDAETGIQSFPDGHDYAVRFKQGVQKSLHYSKMVSEGGRVYVLLERGR